MKKKLIFQPEPMMRFQTEMQHPIPDLRSAPIREHTSLPYSPLSSVQHRSTSLEPQAKELYIPIQRPHFPKNVSNALR